MREVDHGGVTAQVATSFARTFTAEHPNHSSGPFIGSAAIARTSFPTSTIAASSPIESPRITSPLLVLKCLNTIFCKTYVGTSPGKKFMGPSSVCMSKGLEKKLSIYLLLVNCGECAFWYELNFLS